MDYLSLEKDIHAVNVDFEDADIVCIEDFLYEDKVFSNDFLEKQSEICKKIKSAVETVGKDICIEAYQKPHYLSSVCDTLDKFAKQYLKYEQYTEKVTQLLNLIPENIRERKLKRFIYAYIVSTSGKIPRFLSNVDDELIVGDVLRLYKNTDQNLLQCANNIKKHFGIE